MSSENRGKAICETIKALKFNEHLRKLAEKREKYQKKVREKKCTDMEEQVLIKAIVCDKSKQSKKKVLGREEACEAATKQTSSANAQLKIHFNYNTQKGALSI